MSAERIITNARKLAALLSQMDYPRPNVRIHISQDEMNQVREWMYSAQYYQTADASTFPARGMSIFGIKHEVDESP